MLLILWKMLTKLQSQQRGAAPTFFYSVAPSAASELDQTGTLWLRRRYKHHTRLMDFVRKSDGVQILSDNCITHDYINIFQMIQVCSVSAEMELCRFSSFITV